MKLTVDRTVGLRAREEMEAYLVRHPMPVKQLCELIGINHRNFYQWGLGKESPGTPMLQRLAFFGFDVVYILTGRRSNAKQDH